MINNKLKYNEKQLEAIESLNPNVAIIAPAGSGKTSTLVGAIVEHRENNPNESITAITFTRKAAGELKDRIPFVENISVATIHSWSYQELVNLSKKMQNDPDKAFRIRMLDEEKIKEILSDLSRRRNYYYIRLNELYFYIIGNYNIDITDAVRSMYEAVLTDYTTYKRSNGLYDFTDLPLYLLDKLNDTGQTIEGIDALFVDEFQDVDPVQLKVLDKVASEKKFYIGDFAQSIYQFRGATKDIMRHVPQFKVMGLDINYRSYQEIIDFASTARDYMKDVGLEFSKVFETRPSSIICERGRGGKVYTLSQGGSAMEVNKNFKLNGVNLIREILRENPMFLCRTNREVKHLQNMGIENVSTVHQAKGLEYDAVIATDFKIKGDEDVNVGYVALTRAKNTLVAASFEGLVKVLRRIDIKKETGVGLIADLF